ncbi:MAG: metal-dependent transcriptional regulator [Clostridiales bacterium]|nr:metal-dependent transcriptional regulator [Clostridiales bacterium]
MHSHKTNESQEDYLERIFLITMQKGSCRSVDVANDLEVSKASVSVAVSKLQSGGYLHKDDDHTLHLTELGEQTARKIYDRHLTLKEMLEKIGVASELAEQEACRMEHVISDDSISKLKLAIQNKACMKE